MISQAIAYQPPVAMIPDELKCHSVFEGYGWNPAALVPASVAKTVSDFAKIWPRWSWNAMAITALNARKDYAPLGVVGPRIMKEHRISDTNTVFRTFLITCRLITRMGADASLTKSSDVRSLACPLSKVEFETLPKFLDNALNALGAVYLPDHDAVQLNLDAGGDDIRRYLGTYLPRSVIEARTIIRELLMIPAVAAALSCRKTIRILDVGSGTGGSWIGTVLALRDAGISANLVVDAIDGNASALERQLPLKVAMQKALGVSISHRVVTKRLRSDCATNFGVDLADATKDSKAPYDLILVWKHLSEYYRASYHKAQGIISESFKVLSGVLAPTGQLVVLDLTDKGTQPKFFSETLANEVQDYITTPGARLSVVAPLSCALFAGTTCQGSCFTQRKFSINHALRTRDVSKVTYRILAHKPFACDLLTGLHKADGYRVNAAKPATACCNGQIIVDPHLPCGYSELI
jgi:hypothetical protein